MLVTHKSEILGGLINFNIPIGPEDVLILLFVGLCGFCWYCGGWGAALFWWCGAGVGCFICDAPCICYIRLCNRNITFYLIFGLTIGGLRELEGNASNLVFYNVAYGISYVRKISMCQLVKSLWLAIVSR